MKTNLYQKFTNHLPLIGVISAVGLFIMAATYYPGGTTDSPNTVGYHWAQNFISALFAPTALNGAPNPARWVAILAIFMLSVSIGALSLRIRANVTSPIHKSLLQIGGIGTMIYTFFVATPLNHTIMISFALPFALAVLLTLLHLLYVSRRWLLFLCGLVSLVLLLLSAVMYYETWLWEYLSVIQKVSLVACISWALAVYYALLNPVTQASIAPNMTIEPTRPVLH